MHRPYFASAPLSIEQIKKQLPVMRSAVKEYVEEMGITGTFFERMFNTDPSEMDILGDDAEKIVPYVDPTYGEIRTSLDARHYGITTLEYRRRNSLSKSCFGRPKYCVGSIMWSSPPATYRSRSAKAEVTCDLSDSERQLLDAIPTRDRESHSIAVQRDTCWVNTMRGLPTSRDETRPLPTPPQGLPNMDETLPVGSK